MQTPIAAHIAGVREILSCVADGYSFMLELNAALLKLGHRITLSYSILVTLSSTVHLKQIEGV